MKAKIIFCLALLLTGGLSGCSSAKFEMMPDLRQLTKSRPIIAAVTCIEAKPRLYTTFRDHNFRIGVMPPHVRWTATFEVNGILKGKFTGQTLRLVDSIKAGNPYSYFLFEAGKSYTVGFRSVSDKKVHGFAVLGDGTDPNDAWRNMPPDPEGSWRP